MLIFVPVFLIEFSAAAAAGWKLRHFWARAVACILIPTACTLAVWGILEAISRGSEWNGVALVTVAVPGVIVSVLGGFAGYAARAFRAR